MAMTGWDIVSEKIEAGRLRREKIDRIATAISNAAKYHAPDNQHVEGNVNKMAEAAYKAMGFV